MSVNPCRGSVAAVAVMSILLSAAAVVLPAEEPPVETMAAPGPVGVERYDVACQAGEPMTIEVAPSTGRVELDFACQCFDSAEAAAAQILSWGQMVMRGDQISVPHQSKRVAEPAPGEPVPVVVYCLAKAQVEDYLSLLTPAQIDMTDQ